MATSSFFYGSSPAPEQNTINELIADLEAKVASAQEASNAAAQSATVAQAYAESATAAEQSVSALLVQAQATLVAAQAAQEAAEDALAQAQAALVEVQADLDAAEAAKLAAQAAQALAQTAATNAQTSATNAQTSATNASTSASQAASSASAASSSASSASTSATNSANSASASATSASNAASSAADAQAYELSAQEWATKTTGPVAGGEYSAKYNAQQAASSASAASSSASSASGSASAASAAQVAAETARDQTLTAYDNFDDRYLGAKTSDPTLDNDGNALVAGALYFNSSLGYMKVYTGSLWVDAYAAGESFLAKANNLSDLPSVSTARTNLGLGTAATTDASAYATAAQGALADTSIQPSAVQTLTNKTIDSITNKVGADHIHYKVKATQALSKGNVVKVTGYNAGENAFEVAKVSSASDVAVGVVYNNMASGDLGPIINTGLLEGVDTSAFSIGAVLYPNTSGGFTTTKPTSGYYQAIAYVVRSSATNGTILIEASEPQATSLSQFQNDSGFATTTYVDNKATATEGNALAFAIALG